jgi:hypothetical protein
MANNDVPGFFLNLPEYLLMPSGKELAENFQTYLEGETMQRLKDLTHITTILSIDSLDSDLKKDIALQMEMLQDLNLWSKGQFTNTTSSTTNG